MNKQAPTLAERGRGKRLLLVLEFWRSERLRFVGMVLLTLAGSATTVAYPRILGLLVDVVVNGLKDPANFAPGRLVSFTALMLGAGGVSSVLGNLLPVLAFNTGQLFNWRCRTNIFRRVLLMGSRFINTYPTGDVIERLDQDLGDVGWFSGWGIFWPMMSVVTLLFVLVMLIQMNWQLTLIAVLPASAMVIVWRRLQPLVEKSWKELRERISETNNFLEASFSGIRLVKAYTMEERNGARFRTILSARIGWALKVARLNALLQAMFGSISEVAVLLILGVGGVLVVRGVLSLGEFVAFYAYVGLLIWPMMGIGDVVVRVRQTGIEEERARALREFPPDVDTAVGARPAPETGEIRLTDVAYGYTLAGEQVPSSRVLQSISMTIRPGARVGIAGTVGSGKSTLMRLLLRLAEPVEGEITLSGLPLQEYDVKSLHDLFGYAPQEANLVSDTVLNNITLGRSVGDMTRIASIRDRVPGHATEERVREVTRIAQLEPDLQSMAKGLEEMIGERGLRLSGGQQGRVSIARALLSRPRILLLDDVTASLDAETEQQFIRDVGEYMSDATMVIVSHRLSILALCDIVYVMDKGRIVESGRHQELLDRRGTYWQLYQRQLSTEACGQPGAIDMRDSSV
jgi:ATP-binding cassette subfamily B protein